MSKPGELTVDVSAWPLMALHMGGMLEDANLATFFDGFTRAFAREAPFVVLADARTLLPDNPRGARHRSEIAEYIKAHRNLAKSYCRGMAVLLGSRPIAIGLNAIFVLTPMPVPVHTATNPQAAGAWMGNLCAKQGMMTPALDTALHTWEMRLSR